MTDEAQVLGVLRTHWSVVAPRLVPLTGGMNSRTWIVPGAEGRSGQRLVAKLVRPDQHDCFARGLRAATLVDAAGTPAGAPLPTRDGRDHADLPLGSLALLTWVEGEPLTGRTPVEQSQIGTALWAAHRALRQVVDPAAQAFPRWVDVDAPHLAVETWVRPAVRDAISACRPLGALDDGGLGFGLLHADPEPGAFLLPAAGGPVGIIDWSSAEQGPLLYDVASAVMYVGGIKRGRTLLDAYAKAVDVNADALLPSLRRMLALRQAVQADYFARRLAANDLTGVSDSEDNWTGLHHARRFFGSPG